MKIKLVLVATLLQAVLAIPFANKPDLKRQSLPGLLGLDPSETSQPNSTATSSNSKSQSTDAGGGGIFSGLILTDNTPTRTKTSVAHSTVTPTSITKGQPTSSTTSASTPTPASTNTANNIQADASSGDSKTWKVVGVAVISVIAVALGITCVIFWDRGTRFVQEALFGKKKTEGVEDFVPDWEKRSWEVKLAEDNRRYPAVPSESQDALVRAPSTLSHISDEDDKRHPFPLRPGPVPVPVFVDFVSPNTQGIGTSENRSYSSMTTAGLQRQNSRAAQDAYTAYT
ncbi:hypothetical protein PILCRDRAFT_813840 [Piloderma croceum F 1598]|uniref:Mid2 domain-containing protein n=1 Tax=Piloderma croceum (strain F 1598) TaxID=765440 RepID=A0A0C3CGH2_PILCF|nr:hypothetical protein PILCRDRAFT_813840 [Piloderma croceum F 1598]